MIMVSLNNIKILVCEVWLAGGGKGDWRLEVWGGGGTHLAAAALCIALKEVAGIRGNLRDWFVWLELPAVGVYLRPDQSILFLAFEQSRSIT